jgi:glucose/arabinose dehydrogenase
MPRFLPRSTAVLFVLIVLFLGASSGRAALPTNFADQLVVGNLSQPSSFAFLPDGRILVVEQKTARVRLVVAGAADTTLTIPDVNISGNERGLLGIAVDPDWPVRPHIYFYFDQTPSIKNYIVMYTASGDLSNPASSNLTLGNRYNIITDIPDAANNHNGGTLRFGPDKKLYASLGEDADACGAQDSTTFKGVILRLDVSQLPQGGSGPPAKSLITPIDNPFTGGNANAALVWAFGLRNPFRFHIDPQNGRLMIADVGQNSWEEVDQCLGAENFGWPNYEGPDELITTCPVQSAYTPPVAWYDRTVFAGSAAVISATLYRPMPGGIYNFPAEYHGNYFYAEYYQGFIRRITDYTGTWLPAAAVPGQPNATDWGTAIANVSDYLVGPDGGLYYCKQFSAASIRRIVYTANQGGVGDGGGNRPPILSVSPNPFAPGHGNARIEFRTERPGPVEIGVYDLSGRNMATIPAYADDGKSHIVSWNGFGRDGQPLRSGIYFLKMSGAKNDGTARLVISAR